MKLKYLLLILVLFYLSPFNHVNAQDDFKITKKDVLVPDSTTAIKIAKIIWSSHYKIGEIVKDFNVKLNDNKWEVTAKLPEGHIKLRFYILISKNDAKIYKLAYYDNNNFVVELKKNTSLFKDSLTAVKIAEVIWLPIFGKEVLNQKPYIANLSDSIWHVRGSLQKPSQEVLNEVNIEYAPTGGTAYIEINKKDGRILKVLHDE